jgi:hypothetical protein
MMTQSHKKPLAGCAAFLLALFGWANADELALSARGSLLFSDDFSATAAVWAGKTGDWDIANGVVKVAERPEDHHDAVRRHPLRFHDGVFEFSFRFDGAERVALMLNEKNAHVCFLYLTPKGMYLQTGKLAGNIGEARKLASLDTPIEVGKWHKAVVEVRGARMTAQLDGKRSIAGESSRIDVDKIDFGFLVGGLSASLDDVKVYEVGSK